MKIVFSRLAGRTVSELFKMRDRSKVSRELGANILYIEKTLSFLAFGLSQEK